MSSLNSPDPCETAPLHKTANEDSSSDKVRMKKQLGLIEGVAIILGIIFGSGWYFKLLFECIFF